MAKVSPYTYSNIDAHGAFMLRWGNRVRLMGEHFQAVDADIIGLSEVDAFCIEDNDHAHAAEALHRVMSRLGYDKVQCCRAAAESDTAASLAKTPDVASAIFYKRDKFEIVRKHYQRFNSSDNHFFMYCTFCLKDDHSFRFIFCETNLIEGVNNKQKRKG